VSSVATTFPNSFLANSSVTIGSTSVALGATSTTLDSVNIGATTAGTGAFTTLSASSTTTLSGGTANGVAYLNGSKVLTTGTALVFDGTTFTSNTSITKLRTGTNVNASFQTSPLDATGIQMLGVNDAGNAFTPLWFSGSYLGYAISGSEQMRLTNTGLFIGASSGSSKLQVSGAIRTTGSDSTAVASSGVMRYIAGTTMGFVSYGANTSTPGAFNFTGLSSDASAGDVRATIDTAGNLGLGVTPSASTLPTIQSNYGVLSGNTNINIVRNAYYNSGWKYVASAAATQYQQDTGSHYWFNAPSGTAGNAITFTQAMTLDASGNLMVGKTASSATTVGFEVTGASGAVYSTMASSTNAQSTWNVYSTGAAAYRFYVDMAGTIHATSIVITAISDRRLKENVRDIDAGLSSIMALKPRRFDWKEGKGQDKKNAAGFIADEFETVFPECVGVSKAGGDGIEYKNINHETLIPTLVKAIQEQQAIIESLKARLDAANL
jgi:hypothetical protein